MPADHAFDIDSTVGRYWLANGFGFELVERGGRSLGVVENVVLDPSTQRVDDVVVKRHAGMRRTHVAPGDLTAVVPAAKVFVVAKRTSEAPPPPIARRLAALVAAGVKLTQDHWPEVRRRLGVGAAIALDVSKRAVLAAARGVYRAWRWLRDREQVDSGRRPRGDRTTGRSG